MGVKADILPCPRLAPSHLSHGSCTQPQQHQAPRGGQRWGSCAMHQLGQAQRPVRPSMKAVAQMLQLSLTMLVATIWL